MRGKVQAVWRGGGTRKIESAADGSNRKGMEVSKRQYAAAAKNVSGTGRFTAALFPARRAARVVPVVQRSEAYGDVAQRVDYAVWIFAIGERYLSIPVGRIPFYRD